MPYQENLQEILREHIPLKQGLRHYIPKTNAKFIPPQRAYSIKTRIKTSCKGSSGLRRPCSQRAYSIKTRIKTRLKGLKRGTRPLAQRAYSIKTRIKTLLHPLTEVLRILREHIPLKQGLRLYSFPHIGFCSQYSESIFH